ncbi:N-acetylmuramoyl-L-alanine amidase family protein [Nodularia spumigena]|uniref:N-acetylmuramoyl-L-alanine amidase family protein n=1 Tax=Nodularia spumigena TaxID=70799 RepID=UPI0030DD2859
MRSLLGLIILGSLVTPTVAWAQVKVVYPPANHETNTDKIFLLGTAPPTGQVLINNQPIQRSKSGHFAPSFPLEVGENLFTVRYQNQEIQKLVTRVDHQPQIPQGLAFVKDSLTPKVDISRLPGEKICFSAIALTFHYRFLADDGDAENTKGVSSYWYYPQAHSLAVLLQNRLVQNLGRSSFGVYWNNLALTRPHSAPSVLLELGFMSNPDDFELAMDVEEQRRLARVLAEGVVEWFNK